MPQRRDRLDVLVVPSEPDQPIDHEAVSALFRRWQGAGLLVPGHHPLRCKAGPGADSLMAGGFGTLWLDRPAGVTLYANQLGGFRVMCPRCHAPLALAFGKGVQRWRAGGDPTVRCVHCGESRPVSEVPLQPPGAFGMGAVVFGDARGLRPSDLALDQLRPLLGQPRVVLRRRV